MTLSEYAGVRARLRFRFGFRFGFRFRFRFGFRFRFRFWFRFKVRGRGRVVAQPCLHDAINQLPVACVCCVHQQAIGP